MVPIIFRKQMESFDLEAPPINRRSLNEVSWEEFYGKFNNEAKKYLDFNLTEQIKVLIQKNLRKMKESMRKLRESSR